MSHDCPPAAAQRYHSELPEVERFDPQAEEALIAQRTAQWREALQPANAFLVWVVGQIAELSVRIEDCARRHRARRDYLARRAAECWDDDRRKDAERLGASLAGDPARVSRALQETIQGCQWMIERWEALVKILKSQWGWNDAQRRLALDLLGMPEELRAEPHPFDLPGGDLAPALTLVGDQIKALAWRRDYIVRGFDIVAREAEAQGLDLAGDKVLIQIHREEAAYRRQQQSALARFPNPRLGARPTVASQFSQPPQLPSSPFAPVPKPPAAVAAKPVAIPLPEAPPPPQVVASTAALAPTGPVVEDLIAPSSLVGEGWDIPSPLSPSKTEQAHALPRVPLAHGRSVPPRAPRNRHERRALQRVACRA